jgi:hypothetical protein
VGGNPQYNLHEHNPYTVWNRLFGGAGPGGTVLDPKAIERIRAERRSIFDFVGREFGSLAKNLGTDDRKKVELHQTHMRQIEKELDVSASSSSAGCSPVKLPDMDPKGVTQPWFENRINTDKAIRVQMDQSIAALRCDTTRVATFMLVDGANEGCSFPFLGIEKQHHQYAHGAGSGSDETNGDALGKRKVDKWFHEQLAYFLGQLKATPEGNGTMLDNSLVVFLNNMNNGAGHGYTSGVPFLLAGNCQNTFRTGRYVKFASPNQPHNGILTAIANGVLDGIEPPVKFFGDARYGGEPPEIRGR